MGALLRAASTLALALPCALAGAGCVDWRFQAGLASAPALNSHDSWSVDDLAPAHDVIANGDQSCPASGRAEDDRLLHRWPPCGGGKWLPAGLSLSPSHHQEAPPPRPPRETDPAWWPDFGRP